MNDTVKLIIEIDEKIIQQAKHYHDLPYDDYVIRVAEAIANGTPLDEVKAEIESGSFSDLEGDTYIYVPYAFEILDNIGKAESEGQYDRGRT